MSKHAMQSAKHRKRAGERLRAELRSQHRVPNSDWTQDPDQPGLAHCSRAEAAKATRRRQLKLRDERMCRNGISPKMGRRRGLRAPEPTKRELEQGVLRRGRWQ